MQDLTESQICTQGNYVRLTSNADSILCSEDENEDVLDWAGAEIEVFPKKIRINHYNN